MSAMATTLRKAHKSGSTIFAVIVTVRTIFRIVSAITGAIAASLVIANRVFDREAQRDAEELFANSRTPEAGREPRILREDDIAGLPEPVQRWLRHSGVIGKERVNTVRLKQRGFFRMRKDQPWSPIEAEQYYTVDPPAFVWHATMKPSRFIWIKGEDRYMGGKGRMRIMLMGMVPIIDMQGPKLDQATLVRYLSEMPWFPSAALSEYITWEPIDDTSAKATMTYEGVTASGIFHFHPDGSLKDMVAQRYRLVGKDLVLDTWETPAEGEREFNGVTIAARGEAIWKLSTGDEPYGRLEIAEIEYNTPALY
jgi:hypothetical protein